MPQPPDFCYDVFLSHNHADKPRVRRLANPLKAEVPIHPHPSSFILSTRAADSSRSCRAPLLSRIRTGATRLWTSARNPTRRLQVMLATLLPKLLNGS